MVRHGLSNDGRAMALEANVASCNFFCWGHASFGTISIHFIIMAIAFWVRHEVVFVYCDSQGFCETTLLVLMLGSAYCGFRLLFL